MIRRSSEVPTLPDLSGGIGTTSRIELEVTESDTAVSFRSGDVAVLATPRLIALCEEASCHLLRDRIPSGHTSVATRIGFDHLAPVAVGATVTAEATLSKVEGRRLTFTVSATNHSDHRHGLVGAGRLTRVIVDEEAFLSKAGCGR